MVKRGTMRELLAAEGVEFGGPTEVKHCGEPMIVGPVGEDNIDIACACCEFRVEIAIDISDILRSLIMVKMGGE